MKKPKQEYKYIIIQGEDQSGQIISGEYTPGLEINLEIARELVESRLNFCQGKNVYVLVDFSNIKSVTKEARDYMSNPDGGLKGVLGGAFLSNNAVATFFVNLYFKISKPSIPSRFFTNRTEALEWLTKLKNESNTSENLSK